MKTKEKRMILILIVVTVVIIGILVIVKNSRKKENEGEQEEIKEKYVEVLDDGIKLNNSNKLNETKKLGDLEIRGIQLTYQNGKTELLATVTNTGNTDSELTLIELTLYDDAGNAIKKINGIISPTKAGESTQLNMGTSLDFVNAYDFSVVKK